MVTAVTTSAVALAPIATGRVARTTVVSLAGHTGPPVGALIAGLALTVAVSLILAIVYVMLRYA